MLPQIQNLPSDQSRLLNLFKELDDKDQAVLIAFAEFLKQRDGYTREESGKKLSSDPIPMERPEEESVIAAIKRLSSSYHMLDTSALLTETSSLMTAHLIHGRSASNVIDEMEELFTKEYAEFLADNGE